MNRKTIAVGAVLAAMLLMGACSPDGGGAAPSASGAAQTPTAGSSAQTSAESLIATVKQRGVLRLGVAPNPPYAYLDTASGKWKGVFVDVIKDWTDNVLKVKLETVATTFQNMVAGLQAHQFDLGTSLNPTPIRSTVIVFSSVVQPSMDAFVINPAVVSAKNYAELNSSKTRVCVSQGSTADFALTSHKSAMQPTRLPDAQSCVLALTTGRVDAFLTVQRAAAGVAAVHAGYKLIWPDTGWTLSGSAFGIAPGYSFMDVMALNTQIQDFAASGKMAESLVANKAINPLDYALGTPPAYVTRTLADAGS
jgi:polar amino acid transport system substrate-binding protein